MNEIEPKNFRIKFAFLNGFILCSAAFAIFYFGGFFESKGSLNSSSVLAAAQSTQDFGTDLFENLPTPRFDQIVAGRSSTDHNEKNQDHGQFLYQENGQKVLLDLKGPGVVYRFWATGFNDNASLQFFFDGETTPRIKTTWRKFFSGRSAPFAPPLVVDENISSGGASSYVPLTFSKSIKVTASSCDYYNFAYTLLPQDTKINSWTGREDLSALSNSWLHVGEDPKLVNENQTIEKNTDIGSKQSVAIFEAQNSGSISSIRVKIRGVTEKNVDPKILNNIFVRGYFDDDTADSPSVIAPLSMFFAMSPFGAPQAPARSIAVGIDHDDNLYFYFPMPFATKARIELVNQGSAPIDGVRTQVSYKKTNANQVEHFKTFYQPLFTPKLGQDLPILKTTGSGSLVGVVIGYNSPSKKLQWYLEGNERIYIDGAMSPAINGTGTEDFFNAGWYFQKGPFTQPLDGNPYHLAGASSDQLVAYRLFVQDAVVFRNQIAASIQFGSEDEFLPLQATILTYYYQQPHPKSIQTDLIHVGNLADEAAHHYGITKTTFSGSRTYRYPGVLSRQALNDSGRAHQGTSQFQVKIAPENSGVILRRRTDLSVGRQHANVFVDDRLVGEWYEPESNLVNRWKDSEFLIPARFTAEKSSLSIRIEFIDSSLDWNEFTYFISSIIN